MSSPEQREISQLRSRLATLEANCAIAAHKLRMVQMENRLLRRRLWHLLKSSPARPSEEVTIDGEPLRIGSGN